MAGGGRGGLILGMISVCYCDRNNYFAGGARSDP